MLHAYRLPVSPSSVLEWSDLPEEAERRCSLPLHYVAGPEQAFRPGEVSVWWTNEALWLSARLQDDEPICSAREDYEPLWQLGDVFETFLKVAPSEEYLELHVSPTAHRLQLRFPNASAIAQIRASRLPIDDFLVKNPLFDFLVRPIPSGWQVLSRIPHPGLVEGATILFSCSRYDAGPDRDPVLSSTSRHTEVNFHRQQDWTPITLAV